MEVDDVRRHYGATDDACRLTVTRKGKRAARVRVSADHAARPRLREAARRLDRSDRKGSTRAAEVVRRYGTGARAAGCDTSGDSGPEMHPPGQQGGAKSGAAARGSGLRSAGAARAMR
jgi:NADPH-dependent 2,4-dienoyl-CoA reductase/sulfur reductase-like enzyme